MAYSGQWSVHMLLAIIMDSQINTALSYRYEQLTQTLILTNVLVYLIMLDDFTMNRNMQYTMIFICPRPYAHC